MNSEPTKLLEVISSFENLHAAFLECSRRKRAKAGYQNFLFAYGEKLKSIEQEMNLTGNFQWSGYREFFVYDPKKRLVMAAPFRDRITHTAIHRVMFPLIDPTLGGRTYACRYNMGNHHAALNLLNQLRLMGQKRYCIKLDVRKYFESIPHSVLLKKLFTALPDTSIRPLLESLLASHLGYRNLKRGIPIGNLTSQLFANFFLSSLDHLACEKLEISFTEDKKEKQGHYIRYMDDMVILADTKERAIHTATALVNHAKNDLELNIPPEKFMVLGKAPIPFLGFVMSENGYRPLKRNERRFAKKMRRVTAKGASLSLKAQMLQSYESWQELEKIKV